MHSMQHHRLTRTSVWFLLLAAVAFTSTGCAVLAGGAAGAATGYVAGRAARD